MPQERGRGAGDSWGYGDRVDPTLAFVEVVNGPARHVDLAQTALLLSAHVRPDIDLEAQDARVQDLADRCPEPTLDGVRRAIFTEAGFTGDQDNYYAPANSLLDAVLDRRRGLPITLSLLTIDVGRRVGVPLDGVGMPGHFLVRDRVLPDVFIDPFAGGTVLSTEDCRGIFRRMAGPDAPFDPRFLDPISDTLLLSRMVANLVNAYRRADDRRGLRWSARLRSRCPGVAPDELAQLGQALSHAGAFDEAAALLDAAADGTPDSSRSGPLRLQAAHARARLN